MLNTLRVLVPLRYDLVPAQLGPHLCPAEPVEHTEEQDADTNNREDVVRVAICVPGAGRRNEGHDGQENVGGEVKHGNRQVCVPWGLPALLLRVMQVDQASGDKSIDPGTGVGVQISDEVVCGSSGGRNENNDSDQPVEEERWCRGAKGLDGSPELAVRKEAFFREFLVQTSVGKTDCKHVAQIAERDKSRETARSGTVAEDIAEEDSSDDGFTSCKIFF